MNIDLIRQFLMSVDPMADNSTQNFTISQTLIKVFALVVLVAVIYFFNKQIQIWLANIVKKFGQKIGVWSVDKEYYIQKYVYQHSGGIVARFYRFINEQLIALGLKRAGVTVVGYLLFWGFASIVLGAVICVVFGLWSLAIFIIVLLFVVEIMMTRVLVAQKMENREAEIMNAVDLIVPEIGNGVKNAIVMYLDNFAPGIREEFRTFVTNIQDRGYTFEDAMMLLTDSLGLIFQDFAQKAIYFEAVGEKDMQEIFTDITETNRLRRQLRDENNAAFARLKSTFVISTIMTAGYFVFLMFTDPFSREFFLNSVIGNFLLIAMVMVVFLVLSYITSIKSRAI